MNKKYLWIITALIFLIGIQNVNAFPCTTPANNSVIAFNNYTLCNVAGQSSIYVNLSFIGNTGNKQLDCNGSTIQALGNNGTFVNFNGVPNINVTNCNIINYGIGFTGGGAGHNITNINATNVSTFLATTGSNVSVRNSILITLNFSARAFVPGSGDWYYISNNQIVNYNRTFQPFSGSNYDQFTNNNVTCVDSSSYYVGVVLGGSFHNVSNNTIVGCSNGILHDISPVDATKGYSNFYANYLTGQGNAGIKLQGSGFDNITNNTIINEPNYGIEYSSVNNSWTWGNFLQNTTSNSIRMNSDTTWFNLVFNNTVNISGHNCIDIQGRYSNFTGNTVWNCSHFAFNAVTDQDDRNYSNYIMVFNNSAYNSGSCLYFDGIADSIFTNNTCRANHVKTDSNYSIAMVSDGIFNVTTQQISTRNNQAYGNYIDGYDDYAIRDNSVNSSNRWYNNIINNTNQTAYSENFFGIQNATEVDYGIWYYYNNTMQDRTAYYFFGVNKPQYIFLDDFNNGAYIRLNTNRALNITKGYSDLKNVTIFNQTMNITGASTWMPFNDLYNISSGLVISSNINNYNLLLNAGDIFNIGNYNCTSPTDNTSVNISGYKKLCLGTYTNVSFLITASNTYFDCVGSTILYNGGTNTAIDTNFQSNVSITRCNFVNWSLHAIYYRASANGKVYGNNFTLIDGNGVRADRTANFSFYSNRIIGTTNTSVIGNYTNVTWNTNGTGVLFASSSGIMNTNCNVSGNDFTLVRRAVRFNANTTGCLVTNNSVRYVGVNGYGIIAEETFVNNINITYNNMTQCGWDCIVTRGSNNYVYGNSMNEFWHHGFDTLILDTGEPPQQAFNNTISSNYIIDPIYNDPSFNTSQVGIFIAQAQNALIINNTVINSKISSTGATNSTINITIMNNVVINASGSGLYVFANGSTITNNNITFTNIFGAQQFCIETGADYGDRTANTFLTFINNTCDSSQYSYYLTFNGTTYITINQTSPTNLSVNLPVNSGLLLMNYSGNAYLTVSTNINPLLTGVNVSIFNQRNNYPFDDVKNITSGTILASSIINYSILLGTSNQISIGDFGVGCVIPSEDTSFSSNTYTTLCFGNYLLNDLNANGVIQLGNNNVTLDCNASSFEGNMSNVTGSYVIAMNGNNNTVMNCNFKGGYADAINMKNGFNKQHGRIIGNNFSGNYTQDVVLGNQHLNWTITNNYFNINASIKALISDYYYYNDNISANTFINGFWALNINGGLGQALVYNNTFINQSGFADKVASISVNYTFKNNYVQANNCTTLVSLIGGSNVNVSDNNFVCTTGNYFEFDVRVENVSGFTIQRNSMNSSNGIRVLSGSRDGWIVDNVYRNRPAGLFSLVYATNGTNITYARNDHANGDEGVYFADQINLSVINNSWFNNSPRGTQSVITFLILERSNGLVWNNTFNLTDKGIYLINVSNMDIIGNRLDYLIGGNDQWWTGIQSLYYTNNLTIEFNNITNYLQYGVLVGRSRNVNILNNTFSEINETNPALINNTYTSTTSGGFPSAIGVLQIYNSFEADGFTTGVDANVSILSPGITGNATCYRRGEANCTNLTNRITQWTSTNVSISGNYFSPTVRGILETQGTVNLTVDFNPTTYWYREIDELPYLRNSSRLWVSLNYTSLWGYKSSSLGANKTFSTTFCFHTTSCYYNINISITNISFYNNGHAYYAPFNETFAIGVGVKGFNTYPNDVWNMSSNTVFSYDVNDYSFILSPNNYVMVSNLGSAPTGNVFSGGGGSGSSSFSPGQLSCPLNSSFNGSACVANSINLTSSWRVDTSLSNKNVYVNSDPIKSFDIYYYENNTLKDASVSSGKLLWLSGSRDIVLTRVSVGHYRFVFDFTGWSSMDLDVSLLFDGHPKTVSLYIDSSPAPVASVKKVVSDGLSSVSKNNLIIVGVVLGILLLVAIVYSVTRKK